MFINYDIEKITGALADFCNVTGVNISLRRADYSAIPTLYRIHNGTRFCNEITKCPKGRSACQCSDAELVKRCAESRQAEWHICHAGLTDIAVPLIVNGEVIGYIILGQLRNDADFSQIEHRLDAFDVPLDKMREYYSELKYFDSDRTQSVINIAVMLAKYILLENMLEPKCSTNIEKAQEYINCNLSENLSIKSISAGVNISKSVLYRDFRKFLNCTVNEYINILRVERASALLVESEMSVEEIAVVTGFSSSSYLGKTFKKINGITPVKFRNTYKIPKK